MSNRSLLFTTDSMPGPGASPSAIRPLAEWNGLPPTHLLLASVNPKRCRSLLAPDTDSGVAGEYAGGVERLLAFLEALGKLDALVAPNAYAHAVAKAREVLASDEHRGRYVVLEAAGHYDGESAELSAAADRLIREDIRATVRAYEGLIAGAPPRWVHSLAENWADELGLAWSQVVYYSPPSGYAPPPR